MKIIRLDTGTDWDQTTVSEEEADELDIAIAELEQARTARDAAALHYKQIETRVMALMDEREEKTHISPFDGGWQATKVVGERITMDEPALHERIGDRLWDHVTSRVFDKRKLEHAVSLGLINGEDVAECATVQQNSPYLRLTRHRDYEEAGDSARAD